MINVRDWAHQYKYKNYNKAIFKGANPTADYSKDDYKVGCFGQWTCFERCSKNEEIANTHSKNSQGNSFTNNITIFKIHLNGQNRTATNIDLG